MNLKTIFYSRTIPIQQFLNDKIGIEDSFPSEKPDTECIRELNTRIDAMIDELYPWLKKPGIVDPPHEVVIAAPTVEVKPLEHLMRSCTSVNELGKLEKKIDQIKDASEKAAMWIVYDEIYSKLTTPKNQ